MKPPVFDILYEDRSIIVVDKDFNLLTISTEKEKEKTLYHFVSTYCKERWGKNSKIFIIHRLDKDTSGVIAFAKNINVKYDLQKYFEEGTAKRYYEALVSPSTLKDEDTIINYLHQDLKGNVFVSDSKDKYAKKCITKYRVIKRYGDEAFVGIDILTGRKNQIRIAFASIDCPIIGDKKYGNVKNKKMLLNARRLDLSCYNPKYVFESKIRLK